MRRTKKTRVKKRKIAGVEKSKKFTGYILHIPTESRKKEKKKMLLILHFPEANPLTGQSPAVKATRR